jgi:TRAP-type mannitol/chloroaromatic compound transport system permease small subunit
LTGQRQYATTAINQQKEACPMFALLSHFATFCENTNRRIGTFLAWMATATVMLMCVNVILRYVFNAGAPWQVELVLALHATTFLGAMGYAFQEGEQVRVDVFYSRFTPRRKAWVDLLGSCLLLFPLCISLIAFSWDFVASSWRLHEASSEYNGLQGIFLLKSFLLIGPTLLMMQGAAVAIRACEMLATPRSEHG